MSTTKSTLKSFYLQTNSHAKQLVKQHRSSKNPITRFTISILYIIKNKYSIIKSLCVNPNFRYNFFLERLNSKNVHQTTSLTAMNRYPQIFSACRDYFISNQNVKILSYGCSTGEEVLTLRNYFPNAQLIGADINKHNLAKCRTLHIDDKINFIYSNETQLNSNGPYDAIFCMAVLQRTPHLIAEKNIRSLKKIYPFEKFEKQVIELDKLLKPNGILIIHFSQYSLCDTKIASKYKALGNYNQDDYQVPVFDKNSNIIDNPTSQNSIFIKLHD